MTLKFKTLLLLCFIPLLSFAQPLSGPYLIGTDRPVPFNTLQNAIHRLNTSGVSGPVVFLLNDGNYSITGMITINEFAGSSEVNTVTIKPNLTKNVVIQANSLYNYHALPAVFQINGADNIIIDGSNTANGITQNLTIRNNNATTYVSRSVLWVASNGTNPATNVHVKNTKLEFSTRSNAEQLLTGIFVGSNAQNTSNFSLLGTMATAGHSNITITNNLFTNMRQGILVRGNTNPALASSQINIVSNAIGTLNVGQKPSAGIHISNVNAHNITDNNLTGLADAGGGSTIVGGLRIENCSNYNVKRNIIRDVSTNTNYVVMHGLHAIGTHVNGVISENTISNIKSNGAQIGALVIELAATVSANMLIANNMISDVATTNTWQAAAGIGIASGRNIKVYHNTVSSNSAADHISANLGILSGSELDIRNNIFVNRNSVGTRYNVYSAVPASAFTDINYNNYFSLQHVGYLGGDRTFATWSIATGKDANSLNYPPTFTSATNLHITGAVSNNLLDNKGTYIAAVSIDIDDALRSTTTPDMGADEFGAVSCFGTTTWNGTSWSNGTPTSSKNANFVGNFTATTDINACTILVSGTAVVTIPTGKNVYLSGKLTVQNNASFILENNANLLQESAIANSGNIVVKRKSAALKRLDYILWSSPVASQMLGAFSPNTTSNRFYTYNSASNVYNTVTNPAATPFAPAKSYLIRMPNNHPDNTPTQWEGNFTGTPNNGDVTVQVTPLAFTAVGNPYPSAIDADRFIGANNLSSPLYFWRKTNNATTSSYATFTLAGGTGTGPSGVLNPTPGASLVPNGIIPVGQGFITKSVNTTINFDNGMRVNNQNGLFLRTSEVERNRIWLNLTGADGIFSQTLISYMSDATNDVDPAIDGAYFNDSDIALTTIIGSDEYAVQGRALPFDSADIVPVGFKTSVSGEFVISIDNLDGLFADDQQIYLIDNFTGITHALKSAPYNFSTESGIFNERFEIRFQDAMLSNAGFSSQTSGDVRISVDSHTVSVKATANMISKVQIFDISGRLVTSQSNVSDFTMSIAVPPIHQVLIVRVTDVDGIVTIKKVII